MEARETLLTSVEVKAVASDPTHTPQMLWFSNWNHPQDTPRGNRPETLPLNTLTAAVSSRYYNLSDRESLSCRIPPHMDSRFKVGPRISAHFDLILVKTARGCSDCDPITLLRSKCSSWLLF